MVEHEIEALANFIKTVKSDEVTPGLVQEFNARMTKPESPDFWTEG